MAAPEVSEPGVPEEITSVRVEGAGAGCAVAREDGTVLGEQRIRPGTEPVSDGTLGEPVLRNLGALTLDVGNCQLQGPKTP